jgi:4-amino-4-deoxy-L-arabinose transferase-like glycosyltransferase
MAQFVLKTALLAFAGCILILSYVPPVSRDALTHHLAVPKLYLKHGGIFEIPWIEFSYYPMNVDLLYMLPLYLGNDIAPKFIHFCFALLTASLIIVYLKKKTNLTYGLLGAIAFLSIPVITRLSVTIYVDLGLIFFSTASVIGLLRWDTTGYRWRYLIAAAVSCGLALGTKYNGLIVLFITGLLVPLLYVRGEAPTAKRQVKSLWMGALFLVVAVLVFSPWMIRNYAWTNNPVYPLYNNWFNPVMPAQGSSPVVGDGIELLPNGTDAVPQPGVGHFLLRKVMYGESALETLTIPFRVFFQGQDDDPKYFDGKLNPALLMLPILAVLGWRSATAEQRREEQVLLGFSLIYLLAVYVQTDMRIRWIAPIIPLLVIVSMSALWRLELWARREQRPVRKALFWATLGAALLFLFGVNLNYLIRQFDVIQPWGYIGGKISRAEYITRYRPEYPVLEYANHHLPQDARILAFFLGNRTYYSDRYMDCRYGFFYDVLKKAQSEDELFRTLHGQGVSHLLIRLDLFQEQFDSAIAPEEQNTLREFLDNHTRRLFFANGYTLLLLVEAEKGGIRTPMTNTVPATGKTQKDG